MFSGALKTLPDTTSSLALLVSYFLNQNILITKQGWSADIKKKNSVAFSPQMNHIDRWPQMVSEVNDNAAGVTSPEQWVPKAINVDFLGQRYYE
jgi:hypothetical protein